MAPAAALLTVSTACGGTATEGSSGEGSSASSAPAASPDAPKSSVDAAACGSGTKLVDAAQGVSLRIPSGWTSTSTAGGMDVRLFGQDRNAVEGQLAVQQVGQSIDRAVADVERLNSQSEKTAEKTITLPGFDQARALTFTGNDFVNYSVVGVSGRVRAIAYTIVEESPDVRPVAEACMRTLRR